MVRRRIREGGCGRGIGTGAAGGHPGQSITSRTVELRASAKHQMNRKRPTGVITIIVLLVVGFFLPFADSPLIAEDIPPNPDTFRPPSLETIELGLDSAHACLVPTLILIGDQENWEQVWNATHGREVWKHKLPEIDFDVFSVIALFAGRSSAVEGIQILRYEGNDQGRLTIYAVEVEPGLGCTAQKAKKNPFHIVRVPKVRKGITPSLEIEVLSRHCGR